MVDRAAGVMSSDDGFELPELMILLLLDDIVRKEMVTGFRNEHKLVEEAIRRSSMDGDAGLAVGSVRCHVFIER